MKNTKGPWRVTSSANGPTAISHAEDSYSVICRLDAKDPQPILINKANAHLIAAAPEMLEMLEKLLPDICEYRHFYPDKGDEHPHPAISKIINLIKKAKGE